MITVNRITQVSAFDTNGRQQVTYLVNFNVGDNGPFTEQIPKDKFTPEVVRKMLTDFAANLTAISQK